MEDEELTHLGQSLGDIDKFEDVQLSDDDDDDDDMDKSAEGKNCGLNQWLFDFQLVTDFVVCIGIDQVVLGK